MLERILVGAELEIRYQPRRDHGQPGELALRYVAEERTCQRGVGRGS